jgi:ribonuclease P protein component
MLPLKNRLRKKTDIEKVFKKGKGFKEDLLILKKVKNDSEESRFGFIVSQKVSKKASARNKIKRRLKALVEKRLKNIVPGVDVLIMAVPGIEKKDFRGIGKRIDGLFKKAKMI